MTNSRLIYTLLAVSVTVFSTIAAWGAGTAQQMQPTVIAVVDTQLLVRESAAGKDIAQQVEQLRTKYQADIDQRQNALRAEEEELRRQRTILAPEVFADKQRVFGQKVGAMQKYVQDATRLVDQSVAKSMNEIERAILTILSEIREQHGFTLVLDKSQVLYGMKAMDLTPKVLEKLDQKLTKVPVQLPAQQ
jgi:Skp family chaperone for outer membrane proteins